MAGKKGLNVRVFAAMEHDKEARVEIARFIAYGDAMVYVKAKMANPGMIWALYIESGKTVTPVYMASEMCRRAS